MSTDLTTGAKPFSEEELRLITSTVAPGASTKELELFLYRCKAMGLDPLKPGQIHFVKYGSAPGTIVVGIEGFRAKAQRTGKLSGIKRGVLKDEKGKLTGAWAEVYRSDWKECAREEVPLSEYNTGKGPWAKMPETMIKKVAESAALRMAFPDDLGGIYENSEMDQAAHAASNLLPPAAREMAEEMALENPPTDRGYVIDFGKWNKKTLEQVYKDNGPDDIAGYISYIEEAARKKGTQITGRAAAFIAAAESFLGAMENAELPDNHEEAF